MAHTLVHCFCCWVRLKHIEFKLYTELYIIYLQQYLYSEYKILVIVVARFTMIISNTLLLIFIDFNDN
jgi:hypothetical protein